MFKLVTSQFLLAEIGLPLLHRKIGNSIWLKAKRKGKNNLWIGGRTNLLGCHQSSNRAFEHGEYPSFRKKLNVPNAINLRNRRTFDLNLGKQGSYLTSPFQRFLHCLALS